MLNGWWVKLPQGYEVGVAAGEAVMASEAVTVDSGELQEHVSAHPPGSRSRAIAAGGALRQVVFVATVAAMRAAEAFYVRADTTVAADELDRVESAGGAAVQLLALVADDDRFADAHYGQPLALSLARAVATGIHVRGHLAFTKPVVGRRPPAPAVLRALDQQERGYESALAESRRAAAAGEVSATSQLLRELHIEAHRGTALLVERAARLAGSRHPQADAAGLRASVLARRLAMLTAALVLLDRRQRRPRTRTTTSEIAASRAVLRRGFLRPTVARRTLHGVPVGGDTTLMGRLDEVTWVQRPTEPYSLAVFEHGPMLVVPHRSLTRQGVAAGAYVWARGTVRDEASVGVHLKAGFNGPGTHRMTHWEDWLADLVRPAYDLYPGTLAVEWELPQTSDAGRRSDLYIRVV